MLISKVVHVCRVKTWKTEKEGLESENVAASGIWKQLLVYSQQENGDLHSTT